MENCDFEGKQPKILILLIFNICLDPGKAIPAYTSNQYSQEECFENDFIPHDGTQERDGISDQQVIGEAIKDDRNHYWLDQYRT
jgi:hypothetical protein